MLPADDVSHLPEPLFLLERLAHIRCFCLTMRGARGVRLVAASVAAAEGSAIVLRCNLEPGGECLMQLNTGEALDVGTAATACEVVDGYAYLRLPLAPDMSGGGASHDNEHVHANNVEHAPQQLREDVGLYHRAAEQRRREHAALACAQLRCRRCVRAAARGPNSPPVAPLVCVRDAVALPDVDVTSMVDFTQCCEHVKGFDWECVFPPEAPPTPTPAAPDEPPPPADAPAEMTARDDAPRCFLGTHSLHLRGTLPPTVATCVPSEAFLEPPCHRHATAPLGAARWAPLRCRVCEATLGAMRLDAQMEAEVPAEALAVATTRATAEALTEASSSSAADATPTNSTPMTDRVAPLWFDTCAPPELHVTLQLLKSAITCTEEEEGEGADAVDAEEEGEGADAVDAADENYVSAAEARAEAMMMFEDVAMVCEEDGDAAMLCGDAADDDDGGGDDAGSGGGGCGRGGESAESGGGSALHATWDVLSGYSMAAIVADRILQCAEEEEGAQMRTFTLVMPPTPSASPLRDELPTPAATIVLLSPYITLATNQRLPTGAGPGDDDGGAHAVRGQVGVRDALKVLYAAGPLPATKRVGAPPGGGEPVSLVLPEPLEVAGVMAALEASTLMLPPSARGFGALRVGYLPVAPTWD